MINFEARYIPGKENCFTDQLSRPDQVLPTEWFLLPLVFKNMCRELSCSLIDKSLTFKTIFILPWPWRSVWANHGGLGIAYILCCS